MKAIQKTSGSKICVLHTDVKEIQSVHPKYKTYKCVKCGLEWRDCTTSPQVIDEEIAKDINRYYPNCVCCKK